MIQTIQTIRIYSQDIGMEFDIEKMCHAYNKMCEKRISGRKKKSKEIVNIKCLQFNFSCHVVFPCRTIQW